MLNHHKSLILSIFIIVCVCIFNVDAVTPKSAPIILNEETWTQMLKGEWMVDFYAPWCPACKSLKPEWDKLADWSEDLNINVASIDVTENPGLSGRFMVSGLPTIYHVKDGLFRMYSGPRHSKSIISFIDEKSWKSVQPVSRWLSPDTLLMSFVAHSFKISMLLRDVHNYLVETVGLPYYLSYLVFALCTVTLGTILGLLIVFIIDQFCPPQCAAAAQDNSKIAGQSKKDDGKRGKKQSGYTKLSESDLDDSETKTNPTAENLTRRKRN